MQSKDYRMHNFSDILKHSKANWALFKDDGRCFGHLIIKNLRQHSCRIAQLLTFHFCHSTTITTKFYFVAKVPAKMA